MTAKVSSRIRSRCGKSGSSASAAASETDPRMPHQPMTTRVCHGARRSTWDSRRSSARMTKTDRLTPDQAGHDHDEADRHAPPQQLAGRLPGQPVEDHRELQPDQHEQQRVEDEDEDLPDRVALEAHRRRRDLRRPPAEHDSGRDRRQDAREIQRLGRHVAGVAAEQRDRDLDRDVVDPPPDLGDHPADGQADRHAPRGADHEVQARPPRSRTCRRGPRSPSGTRPAPCRR